MLNVVSRSVVIIAGSGWIEFLPNGSSVLHKVDIGVIYLVHHGYKHKISLRCEQFCLAVSVCPFVGLIACHQNVFIVGHAALIGKETGKVISYATRNKFCRKCDFAERNNVTVEDHDCRKNFHGSSKAMEPDMCVSMVTSLRKDDISVGCLEMDNDTTTIAKVRCEVDPAMRKVSDKNHTMKQFSNKLWDLKKNKRYKELSAKTISHIKKCFSFCLAQNSGDDSAIQEGLKAIVPHLYGVHHACSIGWCGYLKDNETYVPKRLPYKRYLQDANLKNDLTRILQDFQQNSHMLAHLGSSQSNESLNNTIASKAPKANFFSGSESNDFRVAAAVAQKNLGYQYISKVRFQI